MQIIIIFASILFWTHYQGFAYRRGVDRNYQYYQEEELIYLSNLDFYIYGLWFKYQPLAGIPPVGIITPLESNSSFLFYQKLKDTQELFSISFITIDYCEKTILLNTRLKTLNSNLNHTFQLDPISFDGNWFYHYYYFVRKTDSYQIYIGYINQTLKVEKQFDNIKLLEQAFFETVFGGGLDTYDSGFNEYFYLTYFLGQIELSLQSKEYFPESVYNSDYYEEMPINLILLVNNETKFNNEQYQQNNSRKYITKNYKINFWVKLNKFDKIDGVANLFHISAIAANNYKSQTGGNIAYLQYYTSETENNKLIFGYYSYDFSYFNQTQDLYKKEQQFDFTLKELKWYLVVVQYFDRKLSFSISNESLDAKLFVEIQCVDQFTSPLFTIYIGGDPYLKSTLSGSVALFYLSTVFSIDEINKHICHYTCLTCDGPHPNNCQSCPESSGRELFEGQCNCKIEYLDIYDQNCYNFTDNTLIEFEKYSKEIICSYGYFRYLDECFQCPLASQDHAIFCQECIVNWRSWIYDPSCTLKIQADYDQANTYINTSIIDHYYTFDQGHLRYCPNCMLCLQEKFIFYCSLYKYQHLSQDVYITCLHMYEYSNDSMECIPKRKYWHSATCPLNCGRCESDGLCFYCNNPSKFYLTSDQLHCNECSIKHCKYCFQVLIQNQFDLTSSTLASQYSYFPIQLSDEEATYCALCYDGYTFNFQTGNCEQRQLPINCVKAYIAFDSSLICLVSISNNFKNNDVSITDCSLYLAYCTECIHNSQQRLFCLKCIAGYYIDTVTGFCQSCFTWFDQKIVKQCKQISNFYGLKDEWLIEIQPFINTFFVGQHIYPMNSGFDVYVSILECQQNYQFYNRDCYYIQETNSCESIGNDAFKYHCQICKISEGQLSYSLDPQNPFSCLSCPRQCKYCQPRTQAEIQSINSEFEVTLASQSSSNYCIKSFSDSTSTSNIFFDTEFMYITFCPTLNSCSLGMKMIIYDNTDWIFDSRQIDYLNMRKVQTIITMIVFTKEDQTYYLQSQLSNIKHYVFSLKRIVVHFQSQTLAFTLQGIQCNAIDDLILEQITLKLILLASTKYIAFNINSNIESSLTVLNSSITIDSVFPLYNKNAAQLFSMSNMKSILFSQTKFYNMYLQFDFLSYQTRTINQTITLQDLIFINVTFYRSGFMRLTNQNPVSLITIQNITLINCTFLDHSAFIISDENFLFSGKIVITNAIIVKVVLQEGSSIFKLPSTNKASLNNINISSCYFSDNSDLFSFYSSKDLIISNIVISNTTFSSSSCLFISGQTQLSLFNFVIEGLLILTFQPLILMENSVSSNLTIVNLISNSITVRQDLIPDNASLCLFELNGQFIYISKLKIEKPYAAKDLCLNNFLNIEISNVEIYSLTNIQKILSPSINCVDLNNNHNSFLYVLDFINVSISNITTSNILLTTSSLLYFNRELSFQAQKINLYNISLVNNVMLKQSINSVVTLISIYSQSELEVNMVFLNLNNNWANHYITDLEIVSPGLIYVIASKINLISSKFTYNIISNSSSSLMFLNAIIINITNITSDNFNYPFNPFSMNNQVLAPFISQIYPQQSIGGIFYLNCQTCILLDSFILNQIASEGGAMIIKVQQQGLVSFQNNTFINNSATSPSNLFGRGGCLYLDASSSTIQFHFINNRIEQSMSKYFGGIIYIQPSKVSNFFQFQKTNVKNAFSQQGSLLYCIFSDQSQNNTIIFEETIVINSEENFNNFVIKGKYSDQDESQWLISTGMLYIVNSGIQINSFYFTGFAPQPILNLQYSGQLRIQSVVITNVEQITGFLINFKQYSWLTKAQITFYLSEIKISMVNVLIVQKTNCSITNMEEIIYSTCFSDIVTVYRQFSIEDQQCKVQAVKTLINGQDKSIVRVDSIIKTEMHTLERLELFNIECSYCDQGILTIFASNLNIRFLNIINNNCGIHGCLSILNDQYSQIIPAIKVSNSLFHNNSAFYGGALYIENASLILQQCRLFDNKATYGGGIFFQSNHENVLIINQTLIFNNFASMSGGGVMLKNYSSQNFFFVISDIFKNRAANGVNNLIGRISYLILSIYGFQSENIRINQHQDFAKFNNSNYFKIPSGQKLANYSQYDYKQRIFRKKLINPKLLAFNQLCEQLSGLNGSKCTAKESLGLIDKYHNNSILSEYSLPFDLENNDFDMSNLIIIFNPYETNQNRGVQLEISCFDQINENYSLFFNFRTYFCQPGEYFSNDACLKCDSSKGQYSVRANQTECQKINTVSIKTITSSELEINLGYWRQHNEISQPSYCYKAEQNCLGGWGTGDSTCWQGNIGALCEECDIYNIRCGGQFQKSIGYSCSLCGELYAIIFKVIIITIWTLVSIYVTVQSSNASNEQLQKLKMKTKFYDIIFKYSQDKAGSLIKMLANYCYIILSIRTFQLAFTIDIPNLLSLFSDPTGTFSYSFDCYLSLNSKIPIIYGRVIWMAMLAIIYFLVYCLLYITYCKFLSLQIKKSMFTTSALYLFTFTSPNLINELVSLMARRSISDISYIKANSAYRYFTPEHQE